VIYVFLIRVFIFSYQNKKVTVNLNLLKMKKKEESVVARNGRLHVSGNRILNKNNEKVCLAGMSYFWSWISDQHFEGWGDKFYNEGTVNELVNEWKCDILRCAVAIEGDNGYIARPDETLEIVYKVVDRAIEKGIYVIVDFHTHEAEKHVGTAKEFFGIIADKYNDVDNVIYEIFNEPIDQSWDEIRGYAEEVIPSIRENDEENLIIVGTRNYSQEVAEAAKSPITSDDNIAYTLHFYAATHLGCEELAREVETDGGYVRSQAEEALAMETIALFVTEWGTVESSGEGEPNSDSTKAWMDFLAENKVSHLNWSVCDKPEGASALVLDASPVGDWNYSADLTPSGEMVKPIIEDWQERVAQVDRKLVEDIK